MDWKEWTACVLSASLALACGGSEKKAESADDADDAVAEKAWAGELKPGTPVCLAGTAGVRYVLEDALAERQLELGEDCLSAEVELEEAGEGGAWELKYRAVGEEWQSCKSKEQERLAFLGECFGSLGAQIGGGE